MLSTGKIKCIRSSTAAEATVLFTNNKGICHHANTFNLGVNVYTTNPSSTQQNTQKSSLTGEVVSIQSSARPNGSLADA